MEGLNTSIKIFIAHEKTLKSKNFYEQSVATFSTPIFCRVRRKTKHLLTEETIISLQYSTGGSYELEAQWGNINTEENLTFPAL